MRYQDDDYGNHGQNYAGNGETFGGVLASQGAYQRNDGQYAANERDEEREVVDDGQKRGNDRDDAKHETRYGESGTLLWSGLRGGRLWGRFRGLLDVRFVGLLVHGSSFYAVS